MRGFGGDGVGGGLRICITSCRTCTMADSCTSNRAVSFFLERSKFLRKLTRAEQCFAHLDEGADDEHAHLNGARAAKDVRSLKRTVLSKGIRMRPPPAAAAF